MDRKPASANTFERCPECEYRLPNHSYKCSIKTNIGRRDFLKKVGAISTVAGIGGAGFLLGEANAIPAPSVGSTIEPGSMNIGASYVIYLDGSTCLARNGKTGVNEFAGTDHSTVINAAIAALASTGGKIFIKSGLYNLNSAIIITGSNIHIEGEGGSADNAATFPQASFQGTILFATSSFPQGASIASPNYMIVIGGNGLVQLQGGSIGRLTLAQSRGYSSGNIAGIAMGYALKYRVYEITFGGYNQSGPTDYSLNGPGLTFNANLSNPAQGSPTGGWFWIDTCYFIRNGGEEAVKFSDPSISDTFFHECIFFGPFFNKGCIYVTNGTGVKFHNCMFYGVGNNNTPAINVVGILTGLEVSGCAFEQQSTNAGAGNTDGFVELNITGDQFLDGIIGVVFLNNTFYIGASVTIPLAYVYKITATTANCPIHETGDVVLNRSGTAITYLNNASTSSLISIEPPPLATNVTLPATRTVTAGASVYTYTNQDGYPEWLLLATAGGISAMTWKGNTASIGVGIMYFLNPGDAVTITWITTAPTFKIVPAPII